MNVTEEVLQGYLSDALNHKQELINLADTKANILIGLIGVILALFFQFVVVDISTLTLSFSLLFVLVPFLIAGLLSLIVIFPRTSKEKQNTPLGLGMIDEKVFIENASTLPMEIIAQDYKDVINILSRVADRKFFYLRLAYLFFVIGAGAKTLIEVMLVTSS
jgi:hypothetical protein